MTDLLQTNILYLLQNNENLFNKIESYLNDREEKRFKLIWEGNFPNITFSNEGEITLIYDKTGNDIYHWSLEYQFLKESSYDVVMYGLGLTYHLVKLLEINANLNFYIIEPEIDLFVEALKVINIDQLLSHPQIKMLHVGNEVSDMDNFIYLKNLYSNQKRVNICIPSYTAIDRSAVTSFYEAEYRAVAIDAVEAGLEQNFGTLPYRNSIRNIEYLFRSHSLALLKGRFLNCTALIVGGGPSLEKDIEIIKTCRNKLLIIAAGSSIQALLRNGIEPHLVVSMDPSEANGKVFENVDTSNVPLVFINQLYTPILDRRPQRNYHAFFISDHILNYFFEDKKLEPKFISNTSVSGTAVQIAVYLGASRIVLTGQDLSFPNNQYYAAGASHLSSEKLMQHMSNQVVKVENVLGGYNDTNYSLKVTLEDFEELIQLLDNITFINSSSMGAKIKGADFQPLEELLGSFDNDFSHDFNLIKEIAQRSTIENSFELNDLLKRISNVEDQCQFIEDQCQSSIKLIREIEEKSRRNPNKAMSLLSKLENEFGQVTGHSMFKLIIPYWNRGLTRKYDQQVVQIEKEPSIVGKAKLLYNIVLPYINTVIVSFNDIKEEFQNLKLRLEQYKENKNG